MAEETGGKGHGIRLTRAGVANLCWHTSESADRQRALRVWRAKLTFQVFGVRDRRFTSHYSRTHIEAAQKLPDVPRLTRQQEGGDGPDRRGQRVPLLPRAARPRRHAAAQQQRLDGMLYLRVCSLTIAYFKGLYIGSLLKLIRRQAYRKTGLLGTFNQ
jgi:hypothetical protein